MPDLPSPLWLYAAKHFYILLYLFMHIFSRNTFIPSSCGCLSNATYALKTPFKKNSIQ